jgi:hypothetical protein
MMAKQLWIRKTEVALAAIALLALVSYLLQVEGVIPMPGRLELLNPIFWMGQNGLPVVVLLAAFGSMTLDVWRPGGRQSVTKTNERLMEE